jgi:hypothetical protein
MLSNLVRKGLPLPGRPERRVGMEAAPGHTETALSAQCVAAKPAWKPLTPFNFEIPK